MIKTDWISAKPYIVGEKFFYTLNKSIIHNLKKFQKKNFNISANLVSDAVMKKLNQQWRKQNKTTDVLSFPYNEDKDLTSGEKSYDGEVIISIDQARKQAVVAGHSLRSEIAVLYIHGVLHILGYDHAQTAEHKQMYGLQSAIFTNWKKLYA